MAFPVNYRVPPLPSLFFFLQFRNQNCVVPCKIYILFFCLSCFCPVVSRRLETGIRQRRRWVEFRVERRKLPPLGQEREGKTKRLRRKIERERESSNKNRRSFFTALDESRLSEREKRFSLFSPHRRRIKPQPIADGLREFRITQTALCCRAHSRSRLFFSLGTFYGLEEEEEKKNFSFPSTYVRKRKLRTN